MTNTWIDFKPAVTENGYVDPFSQYRCKDGIVTVRGQIRILDFVTDVGLLQKLKEPGKVKTR